MKKILENIVEIPVATETNRYVACFTSLLMCIEKLHEGTVAATCVKTDLLCNGCGDCGNPVQNTLGAKHESIYNRYLTVSGDNLQTYAIDDTMGYAGYLYEIVNQREGEQALKERIVASIDQGRPVLIRIANSAENWNLITGYDEDGDVLFGWDGRHSYWWDLSTDHSPVKDGYLENRMFFLRNWYPYPEFALIVTDKTQPSIGNRDVFRQLVATIEAEKATFAEIIENLLQDDVPAMSTEELNALLASSTQILYNQIDARYMASCTFSTTYRDEAPDKLKPIMSEIAHHFLQIHDLSWEVFSCLGEKVDVFYNPSKYVEMLRKPEVRERMAQLIGQIAEHNRQASELLKRT